MSVLSSDLREIPDNQEVFAHSSTDQSIIVEVMEYQQAEDDNQALRYIYITSLYTLFIFWPADGGKGCLPGASQSSANVETTAPLSVIRLL